MVQGSFFFFLCDSDVLLTLKPFPADSVARHLFLESHRIVFAVGTFGRMDELQPNPDETWNSILCSCP